MKKIINNVILFFKEAYLGHLVVFCDDKTARSYALKVIDWKKCNGVK